MEERTGVSNFKGSPVTLLGRGLKAGDHSPEFHVVDTDLNPVAADTEKTGIARKGSSNRSFPSCKMNKNSK